MDDTKDISLYEGEVDKEHWSVTDLESADWAVAKVVEAQGKIAEYAAYGAELKRKVDARIEEATRPYKDSIDLFVGCLHPWARAEIEGQKRKSVKLVAGTVGFRAQPDQIDIADEQALIEWAEEHAPELVRVTKAVDKAELRKAIKAGKEVPRVDVVPGFERIYINGA